MVALLTVGRRADPPLAMHGQAGSAGGLATGRRTDPIRLADRPVGLMSISGITRANKLLTMDGLTGEMWETKETIQKKLKRKWKIVKR